MVAHNILDSSDYHIIKSSSESSEMNHNLVDFPPLLLPEWKLMHF